MLIEIEINEALVNVISLKDKEVTVVFASSRESSSFYQAIVDGMKLFTDQYDQPMRMLKIYEEENNNVD